MKSKKVKAHTVYKLKDGTRVPGTTTITGVLNKPALVPWSNRLGLKGIDVNKYVDELATIGTLSHLMIEKYLKGEKVNFDDYSKNQIDQAQICVNKFFAWEDENEFEILGSEMQLVSEKHLYGGCIDIYCLLNGKKTLVDIKTGKGIFSEMKTQVAGGYELLLKENGYEVEQVRMLRIGRNEDEGFEDPEVFQRELHQERFLACKMIYDLNKKLG